MKRYNWNDEKSKKLKEERGISFEDIVFYIEKGHILDDLDHPNKMKYKNQRILVLEIKHYAYIVPYVQSKEEMFFKTIIPSRKATQKYLKGVDKDEIG
ncbi:BrnT family toxin [bacterium]|nr:BrnT family toxin [bacterium]